MLIAIDELDLCEPWFHPAWALCRALGALGFGLIRLRGAEVFAEDFSLLMEGLPFAQDDSLLEATPACDVVLHLGSDPDSRGACARLAGGDSPARLASAIEFILEGLHLSNRLNKTLGTRGVLFARP